MRTFIFLLLLTNIAYFGWNQGWLRQPPPRPPAAGAATVPELSPFVPAPQTLTLLSELPESERQARGLVPEAEGAAPVALGTQASPVVPAPQPWCAELGPIDSADAARALLPRLGGLGVDADLQMREVPVSSTFWVYLPAFVNEAEARRTLAELQERRIDSYYMRSGQFIGGISLGVFSRRASAESVQADVARQGYQARIGEVLREEPRAFLRLQAQDSAMLEQAGWAEFLGSARAWKLTENVCEGVASGM